MGLSCFPNLKVFIARAQAASFRTHALMSSPVGLDYCTPITILNALQNQEHFFLLESATAEKNISRYSFFAYQMERRFECLAAQNGQAELWLTNFRGQKNERYLLNQANQDKKKSQNPFETLFQQMNPISILPLEDSSQTTPKWQGFHGGLVGMFSYEAVRHMGTLRQPLRQLSTPDSLYGQQPEMLFYEVHRFFVVDNASQNIFAVYLQPLPAEPSLKALETSYQEGQQTLKNMQNDLQQRLQNAPTTSSLPPIYNNDKQSAAELSHQLWQEDQSELQQYQSIKQLRQELTAGEGLQVVYSVGRQSLYTSKSASPFMFYRLLRQQNPSPYMFFFKNHSQYLIGTSPETHLRYQNGIAMIKPIAGTRPLEANISTDRLNAVIDDLLNDAKERAEHLMLIDLARNDLYTNCTADSVRIIKKFAPEVFSHVIHIVSEVQGQLQPGKKPYELFAKTFPAGTLSGAPKVRAIELIDQYEQSPRGFYGGCMGYFNYDGSFDTAIIIRSVWIDGSKIISRSGSGLVYESNPAYEINEHRQKLGILSTVLQTIQNMNDKDKPV